MPPCPGADLLLPSNAGLWPVRGDGTAERFPCLHLDCTKRTICTKTTTPWRALHRRPQEGRPNRMSTKTARPAPRRINSSAARDNFRDLVDDAQRGISHIIVRNRKAVAAVVNPEVALLAPIVREVLLEFGESLQMSEDPDIIAAVKAGMQEIAEGRTVVYEV